MFTCPACGQPDLHFHNIIQRGTLIERRVRCDACGYGRQITWKEKRSMLEGVGIAKRERRAKSRAQGS
jgi:transposase-like protein